MSGNPSIANRTFGSIISFKYENFVTAGRSAESTSTSKVFQNDNQFSSFPLSFVNTSFGSLTWVLVTFVAPWSFWYFAFNSSCSFSNSNCSVSAEPLMFALSESGRPHISSRFPLYGLPASLCVLIVRVSLRFLR